MPLFTDVRHALRLLGRSPIFTLTAVLSLALGIAASSTIFSLADALMFAPRAGVQDASRVVDIGRTTRGGGFDNMAHPAFRYLREHATTLAGMAAVDFSARPMSLTVDESSERLFSSLVSANYFEVLGTRPALGRFFAAEEDRVSGQHPVVVLTHSLWMTRFAGDPGILHAPIRLNNQEFTVVGVAEPGFDGTALVSTDMWIPTAMVATVRGAATSDLLEEPRAVWHVAIGRLAPGASREQADAELNTLMAAYKASEPRANQDHGVAIAPLSRIPGPLRTPFLAFIGILFALTGALLAIACANVAGMLLARATVRRREIATRLAVGASRGRIITQLLTETAVLFFAAALAALPLTVWLMALLVGLLPSLPVPISLELGVNPRVAVFAIGVSLAASLLFGLAPARQALRGNVVSNLYGAHGTADRRRFRLRNTLVVAQVALSLMLVVTAFMFVRTLQNAGAADPGFETRNITLVNVDVGLAGYREQAAVDLVERFRARLAELGGVEAVATGRMIPLQGSSLGLGRLRVPGYADPMGEETIRADWNVVSPEYFETVRMPIVDGRGFAASDRDGATMVAVVNETFARTAWPGRSAVGQRFMQRVFDGKERPIEIVGIAADAKYRYISEDPTPFVFVPLAQQPMTDTTFFIRHAEGRPIAQDARAALAQVEPGVPVLFAQSFEEAVGIGLLPQRVAAWVAGGVGTAGIFLAALGLYGLMAFLVAQRSREIAIRVALGASSGDMQAMVLKQAARLGLYGGLAGLALAAGVGTLARRMLVGVPTVDPVSYGVTTILFVGVLAAAAWIPARRASSTDPASALRAE
jgi:putative ABC transport system permease protein